MRGREVTDAGTVTGLGSCPPSDDTSEGRSSASGDPVSPSQGGVHGWTSGADDGDGWGNLIVLDHG